MKVIVEVEKLKELLKKSKNIINEKSMLTIIHNFYIQAKDNKITVIATDLDSTIIVSDEADVQIEGEIVVSKKVKETIDTMNEGSVTLVVNNNNLKIYYGEDEFIISCIDASEYPRIIKEKEEPILKLNSNVLKNLIYYSNFATSKDTGIFTGIDLTINKNEHIIKMAGTDSHKLGLCTYSNNFEITDKLTESISDYILPSKTMKVLNDIITNEDTIDIAFKDNSVIFMFGNTILTSKLMEGKFPNYNSIIPNDNDKKVIIDRKELLLKIERAKTLSETSQNKISINFENGKIEIFSSNSDIGSETIQKIDSDYEGENINLVFSAVYLIDILKIIKDTHISFEMKSLYSPVIIKPLNIEDNMDIILLIMPLRTK